MLSLFSSFMHLRDARELAYEEEVKTPSSSEVMTPCYSTISSGSSRSSSGERSDEPEELGTDFDGNKGAHWKSLRRCSICTASAAQDVLNVNIVVASDEKIDFERRKKEDMIAISQLGHGSFGRVYLISARDQEHTIKEASKNNVPLKRSERYSLSALKSIPLAALNSKKKAEHVRYERKVVEMLQGHENIIALRGAWRCPNALYLLTEVAWGGELFRHLQHKRRFEPRQVAFWAAEISSALTHAHSLRIVYRDLKPENVLLDAIGHVKLVDFGLSKILSLATVDQAQALDATHGCTSLCGTPEYMAPETLDRREYGFSVDFWALGMISAELLSGLPPWYTSNRNELFRRIRFDPLDLSAVVHAVHRTANKAFMRTGDPVTADSWDIANEASNFLTELLDRNPTRRLGASLKKPYDHVFIRRFYPDHTILSTLIPPYDPSALQAPEPDKKSQVISSLYTHFSRVPLISLEIDDISEQIATEKRADPHVLEERSRLIQTWTYDCQYLEQHLDLDPDKDHPAWLLELNVQRPDLVNSSSLNSSASSSTLSSTGSTSTSPPKRRPTARQFYVSPASTADGQFE